VIGITVILIIVFISLLVFLSDYFIGAKEELVYEEKELLDEVVGR